MDTTLIPIFPIIIFSLHHKSFTSLSTVKLYFQKKIIQNTFWIYANQNHTGKMHSPRSLNKLQKLQFMQKNHLHQFAPHYPLEHFPPFKLPQRSLCFAFILESCSRTLATTPCEETRSQGPTGSATWVLQAQAAHGHVQLGVTLTTLTVLQAATGCLLPGSKAVSSYVATVAWH